MASLEEYRLEQLSKLAQLRSLGINPYPATCQRDLSLAQLRSQFQALKGQSKAIVGRLMSIRQHGRISFLDLADQGDQLQIIVSSSVLSKQSQLSYQQLSLLTRGDFLSVFGQLVESQSGEISIQASKLQILSKVLRPLPLKLADVQTRRRRPYLDLALNPKLRQRFYRRSLFWQNVRDFLNQRDFLEINIPVLEQTTGGAEAQPFKTHMRALDQDFYLRISHELPLKKLLGGGYEKVYDIGPRFRNENYSDEHLPEHIAMEWYWAYADWQAGMDLMEEMFVYLAQKTFGRTQFTFLDKEVQLKQKWPRLDYRQLILEHYQLDVLDTSLKEAKALLKKERIEVDEQINLATAIDKLFKNIRGQLVGPFWLIKPPVYLEPLSKRDNQQPACVQRFQAILAGSEICKGFSELNDPQEQLERLRLQQAERLKGVQETHMLDIDFIEMLEYGMPPACGLGFSERVFWFLEGVSARDGIPFNHLRREFDENTKAIYPDLINDN